MTPAFASASAPRHPRRVRLHPPTASSCGTGRRPRKAPASRSAGTLMPVEPFRDDPARRQRASRTATAKPLGDGPGGPRPRRRELADRRASEEDAGRRHPQTACRSTRCWPRRSAAAPRCLPWSWVCRTCGWWGGCDSGYSCAYSKHHLVELAHHAAALREQPEPGIRAAVRRRRHHDPAVRAIRTRQDRRSARLRARRRHPSAHDAGRRRPPQAERTISTRCARWSVASETRVTTASTCPCSNRPDGIPPTFEEHVPADVGT